MNRPLPIAALVVLLASLPLTAQHGGGHASAGGHGGMASHSSFGGHSFSGNGFNGHGSGFAMGGVRSGSGFASRQSSRSSLRGPFSSRARGHSGIGLQLRTRGFRSNCVGSGCLWSYGYPWWYGGFYDPYWGWDSGSSYDQDQEYETGLANEMNAQSLEEQRMRGQRDQDLYARSAPVPVHHAENMHAENLEAVPATVLVFRDQHKQEVQNYAIVGQALWSFSPQRTQKIPLSELDLPATTKANDDRGVTFRLPGGGEGQ